MTAVSRIRPGFELGLDFCVFLFLPILALASRGAAPLAVAAGLCALGLAAPRRIAAWRRVRGFAPIFAALLVWGLLSALWAVDPAHSLLIALRLTGLFAAGLALAAAAPEIAAPGRLLACLCAGLTVALALTVAQYASSGALTAPFTTRGFIEPALNRVEDGFGFVLLPLVATLLLRRQRIVAGLLAAATLAVIYVLVGDAARIAFVTGIAGAAPIYFWRRGAARAAAIASVLLILTAPLVFPPLARVEAVRDRAEAFKFSAWHRLEIWSFAGSRIAERPLLGWGLDSSRAIPGGTALTPDGHQWLPLHPHNAPLQLWLELGVPGAALFALFAARLWLALGAVAWPPLYAAAAGGSLVTGLVVALGSYGIWQEWMIGSEFLTLFLILVLARVAVSGVAAHRGGLRHRASGNPNHPMPETRRGSIS
ncbi:MAG TPA: O-antigen ligase family protein [Stellaceae bacterium]|nr:O-antigen ligase family protein [Stellaceae bacterium]